MGSKISELTAATTLDGTETVAVVQSSTTKKATANLLTGRLQAFCAAAGGFSSGVPAAVGISTCAKTATGRYTITLSAALTNGGLPIAIPNDANVTCCIASGVVAGGSTFLVKIKTDAGVDVDADFVVKVFPF